MAKKYLVDTLQQWSPMTCVPTVVWMLHRWYLNKIGATFQTPYFDSVVNVTKPAFDLQLRHFQDAVRNGTATEADRLDGGLATNRIGDFVRKYKMESNTIAASPETFETQLVDHGPFIYIESVPHDRLPISLLMQSLSTGIGYEHALLITGIENRRGYMILFFNDPATGKRAEMEYTKFVTREHRSSRGIAETLILYFR